MLRAYSAARNEKSEPSSGTIILFGNSSELSAIVVVCESGETIGDDSLELVPPDFPWQYASAAVNENGDVGVVAYYGQPGAVNIPGVAFGVRNQPDKAEAWNMTSLAISGALPEDVERCEEGDDVVGFLDEECGPDELLTFSYEWGDYITIRSREGPGLDWDAAAYVLEDEGDGDSDTVMPYYFRISNTPSTAS